MQKKRSLLLSSHFSQDRPNFPNRNETTSSFTAPQQLVDKSRRPPRGYDDSKAFWVKAKLVCHVLELGNGRAERTFFLVHHAIFPGEENYA